MDYLKLITGIVLLAVFAWLLIKNFKRSGFVQALFTIDIILGIAAGSYLIIGAFQSFLVR